MLGEGWMGEGGMNREMGWQKGRWDPEERLGNWGCGPVFQGRDQRHSHTFTV